MVMDQSLNGLYGTVNGLKLNDDTLSVLSSQNLVNALKLDNNFVNQHYANIPPLPPDLIHSNSVLSLSMSQDGDSTEDFDFSDVVLKYISEMLMEEDIEGKTCMFQESSAALQAAEKSLYELIGEKYPPSPDYELVSHLGQNHKRPDESHDLNYANYTSSSNNTSGSNLVDTGCNYDLSEYSSLRYASQSSSLSSHSSANSTGTVIDGFVDSPASVISEIFSDSESIMQFKKGFEEASKFLPNGSLFIDLESNGLFLKDLHDESKDAGAALGIEEKQESEKNPDLSRGKKNPHPESLNLQGGRSNKQSLIYTESTVSSAYFDTVLLNCSQNDALREALQHGKSKKMQQNEQTKGSGGGKGRGKKSGGKRNVVDLRTLLTLCAQAVSADDRRSANDLLKQIRQHASPTGDGMQRLAHIFADGLEARMAGSGTQIYEAFMSKPGSAADVLKAYHLFLAACPFRKLSNFFSNKTIMKVAQNAKTLHIVDFGILYGFQWPCLIQRLASRAGGPPKLRITGIDLPRPGFRPAERVEETGRRLSNYAKTFNVPFEFKAIAQKWDTVKIEDLKIDRNEVLVVTCFYRLRNLLDETVVVESPRSIVLNLIRKMNPDVFITGIVNGAYSAPFFITRFREALFHYSTLFDMLETNVPREIPERMLIEREIFRWEAMNVIACEGAERIERPETYKQWHTRALRAGFKQLPLDREMFAAAKEKVNALYHKDFVVDEDSQWFLQGWKGRIVYALSSWKPDC
ncbi:hypothetical protein JCGZ_01438 [Jatropha curcas]|uniref:GRAS07 protein n=1 Tax=Jatropha curcas TaxID=180498 RepID=A0A067LCG6_JATCU|nr:scarecrow-like protein 9 [Jatropha curcas]XP_012089004.1 scarecrow-like protein 9 [Jatropha curcas]AMR43773.1 GRAS07 protein [Jatropha curcas]KDP44938.1 hypothetical protein JCGZ_01438 [Jatropha curcas]